MLRVYINAGAVSRILSLIVVSFYAFAAYAGGGGRSAGEAVLFSIVPLACIWFAEAMGDRAGMTMRGNLRSSPAVLIHVVGWAVLLCPAGLALIQAW